MSGPARDSPLVDPAAPLPDRIGDIGVYPSAPDLDDVPDGVHPYAPNHALWSNGSDKTRHLALGTGTVIDTEDPQAWVFPVGTLVFKTFAYDAMPIETRILRRDADGWDYAVYQWDDDGTDATRLALDDRVAVAQDGFDHTIPARLDCRLCHETAPQAILAIDPQQLSPATIDELDQAGRLSHPVDAHDPVDDPDPRAAALLGFFYGNCVHCHHGGTGDNASFDLRPDVAWANTIGQPTQSSASAVGIRIVAGDAASSVLFQAVSGEHDDPDLEDMPPVGVDRRDAATIEQLRVFIEELPG
jgi:hypothetical protein